MPMKGKFPLRRTLRYLERGNVYLRDTVKIVTINYNTLGETHKGARDFVFYNLPQLQYKNQNVQMQTFKNLTPSPFIRCFLNDGDEVLIDIDSKSNTSILEHVKKLLGKSEEILSAERKAREKKTNPANFGREFARECICQVPGQVPCPSVVPLPEELRGKNIDYRTLLLKSARGRDPNIPDEEEEED
ncbi:small ribosomal subunit protein mS25-like [Apostichopus japonicus]|uniref:small ribosomal subunit protein mS25-like n=1 Tax=Stichopus japonicus TaxID=307972 RepID=UPI003AB502F9